MASDAAWPLAPGRCDAPEPVALCPVVRPGPWCRVWDLPVTEQRAGAYLAWRDAQPTCARGRLLSDDPTKGSTE